MTKKATRAERLAKRRAYYAKNKGRIRAVDNASAKRRKKERAESGQKQPRPESKYVRPPLKAVDIRDNPDFRDIVFAIMEEDIATA